MISEGDDEVRILSEEEWKNSITPFGYENYLNIKFVYEFSILSSPRKNVFLSVRVGCVRGGVLTMGDIITGAQKACGAAQYSGHKRN